MANVLTDESNYEDIADAIREKTESSDTYTPGEMAAAIRSIQTGGDVTGVKGNAESTYRKGNVNLTPANLGAATAEDVTKINNAFRTQIKYYLNLPYPIKAGTHAFEQNTSNSQIMWALQDIPDADSNTPDKWGRYHVDAYAYVKNTQMSIDTLQSALAASEAKRMAMYPTGTLTGPVAAFPDGAEDVPVKVLTVDIASQTGVTGLTLTHTGKNLLPLTLEGIKAANTSGTWSGNTYTVTGVTHTILTDTDGTVTGIRVSGSPTGSRTLFKLCDHTAEFATILSGCPAGGSADSYELQFNGTKRDFGSGTDIAGDGTTGSIYIIIRPGYTASDLLFAPMIRPASIEDSTFEPYHSETYTFDWSEEAGAIAEGTLDVLTGVLETGGDTHSLTPAEVLTMLGANALYADAGEVAVTYRADIALYIARKIAEINA